MSRRSAAMNTNGPAIRELRTARGLSALQLVEALHTEHHITFSRASLYNVELGHKKASPVITNALAAILHVPVTAILNTTPHAPTTTLTPERTRTRRTKRARLTRHQ